MQTAHKDYYQRGIELPRDVAHERYARVTAVIKQVPTIARSYVDEAMGTEYLDDLMEERANTSNIIHSLMCQAVKMKAEGVVHHGADAEFITNACNNCLHILWDVLDINEVIKVEETIFDDDWCVAGTVDLYCRAKIQDPCFLIDYKLSKYDRPDYSIQVNGAYRKMLGGEGAAKPLIFRINPDDATVSVREIQTSFSYDCKEFERRLGTWNYLHTRTSRFKEYKGG